MENINVVVRYSVDVALAHARKLSESEKANYSDEYKDHMLIGIDHIDLSYVRVTDLADYEDRYWYCFSGGYNMAYEVSEAEYNTLLQLNETRSRGEKEKERRERIKYFESIIRRAESQKDIPSESEATRRRKEWNKIYNEGGEGYLPSWVTAEQYRNAKEQLEHLMKGKDRI